VEVAISQQFRTNSRVLVERDFPTPIFMACPSSVEAFHNFVRIHKTLRTSPAMAAGVSDKLWEIGGVVEMLEQWEAARALDLAQPQHVLVG
jgi:hypothetical protein